MGICWSFVNNHGSLVPYIDSTRCLKRDSYDATPRLVTSISQAAKKLWDYMQLHHKLTKCDVILVLGNNDVRTAQYAAQLFKDGLGEWLMFSGKDGSLTRGKWNRPEADVFHDIAVEAEIPEEKIIIEREATNTGENVRFSHTVLKSLGINVKKIILVQTPYMERRAYATFLKQFPGSKDLEHVVMTSPDIPFEEYANNEVGSARDVINALIGCYRRIELYPVLGFQVPQCIPRGVRDAYIYLLNTGAFEYQIDG